MIYIILTIIIAYIIGFITKKLLKTKRVFDFIKYFKYLSILSAIMIGYSIFSLYTYPSNLSIDFAGGRNIQINIHDIDNYDNIKDEINEYINSANLSKYNNSINIKYSSQFKDQDNNVTNILNKYNAEIITDYSIDGSLSETLKVNSLYTLIIVLLIIGLYITVNFNIYYAIGAIIALIHDIILSAFFIQYFNYELSTYTVTALLIILGYSINDTVVIFNKLRYNKRFNNNINYLINKSISETLGRTIMTSISTLIPIFITLYIIPISDILNHMMIILSIGFISGTYSSIFIASPIIRVFLSK